MGPVILLSVLLSWNGTHAGDRVLPSDSHLFANFGSAIAIEGQRALIGSRSASDALHPTGTRTGAVYAFEFVDNAWVETQILRSSDGMEFDQFGWSIDMEGDVAVIGAPGVDGTDDDTGAAYIFRHNGSQWEEEGRLTSFFHPGVPVVEEDRVDRFGAAVSISGNVIMIPVTSRDIGNSEGVGAVYVFRYSDSTNQWDQEARLIASDGGQWDSFGSGAQVVGNFALIGAAGASESGRAYGFRYNGSTWNEIQMFDLDPIPTVTQDVGGVISISGNVALLNKYDRNFIHPNELHVYRRIGTQWQEEQILTAPNGLGTESFGFCAEVSGDVIVASAFRHEGAGGEETGGAYLYHHDGVEWVLEKQLIDRHGSEGDWLGTSVALDDGKVLLGATGWLADHGAAFFFHNPLELDVSNQDPGLGEEIEFTVTGGLPLKPTIFALVELDGTRRFDILSTAQFDDQGEWRASLITPVDLLGAVIRFQSFGIYHPGRAGESLWETVRLQ